MAALLVSLLGKQLRTRAWEQGPIRGPVSGILLVMAK